MGPPNVVTTTSDGNIDGGKYSSDESIAVVLFVFDTHASLEGLCQINLSLSVVCERQMCENQLDSLSIHAYPEDQSDDAPLPRSLDEALKQTNRAIVITETVKPFRVVQVSKAWEGLCGFSSEESIGKSLGALLKGPETDPLTVTSLLAHLLRGEEAGAILTNYTKDKRRFRNRLRVGPMVENSKVTHYVGVLQEVKDGM